MICAALCETLFGLSYVFTKDATGRATPLMLLGWRFTAAFIAMTLCVLAGIMKINLKGKPKKPLILIAALNPVIYFTAETWGISKLTASESGAFLACIPIASLMASTAILRIRPSIRQAAGILITLIGVLATVFASGISASFSPSGYAFLAVAVISYALYSVGVSKASGYTEAEMTYAMLMLGAAAFSAAAAAEALMEGKLETLLLLPFRDKAFLSAVLYQGICCSIGAFFLSNMAISRIGVNRTASFIGLSTAVSIAAGILFLREPFTPLQGVGALLVLAGIYVANRGSARKEA